MDLIRCNDIDRSHYRDFTLIRLSYKSVKVIFFGIFPC